MNRETCETIVFQKLKEIREIIKQYDERKGNDFYFVAFFNGDTITANNDYWEDEVSPIHFSESDKGDLVRHDN